MKEFLKEYWWMIWTIFYYLPVGFYVMTKYGETYNKILFIVQAIWLFPIIIYFLYLVFKPIVVEVNRE